MAMVVTHIAASVGGLVWMLLDVIIKRRMTAMGFCSGAVAGLVAITPGSGYVSPSSAIVFGVCAGVGCYFACVIKLKVGFDDAFDVFAVHGVGGVIGGILTGLFSSLSITALANGTAQSGFNGGWLDRNFIQLGYQLAAIVSIAAWAFALSFIMLKIMYYIPGMNPRTSEANEAVGTDESLVGDHAYDYIPFIRPHVQTRTRGFSGVAIAGHVAPPVDDDKDDDIEMANVSVEHDRAPESPTAGTVESPSAAVPLAEQTAV
eukprot:TRINITY_DN11942_c0_g1_i1.p2 TRINITY_DN11942_c0_g1~~TRINITY_DN11942_c0_g1_i1.p2  ORF type:complete len:271 (-),score=66.67 TRINITY_DN11942_c0_g1_i1:33-815(-)